MATTGSTKIPLETLYEKKPKIIGLLMGLGHIGYVMKRYKFKKQIIEKIQGNHGSICLQSYEGHVKVVQSQNQESHDY